LPEYKAFDASTIILGFTGPIGSGCTYISEKIAKVALPRQYKYYRLSEGIEDVLRKEGNENPTVAQKQDKGNELRRQYGNTYLVKLLFDKINTEGIENSTSIIIDGIKNEGEVYALKQFPYFFLFSVQAPKERRRSRAIKDGRFKTEVEFNEADSRDQLEDSDNGQQVSKCTYQSDIIIKNDIDIPENDDEQTETFVRNIYKKYVNLIENLHEGKDSSDHAPSVDEMCMTIAYALSKSSSCLKRKVGCVIVDAGDNKPDINDHTHKRVNLPFIVSSGYNEVPVGSSPCVYAPEYQKCYRDYLQENYAKTTLECCPRCGNKLEIQTECPFCKEKYNEFVKSCRKCRKEIDFIFTCSKCKNKISSFLPGSQGTGGKLMDMCRSLHAEETALLRLTTRSSNIGNNLVLYVTTQPCNLCSNKIVLSKISKVIYSEPYSMKEAFGILERGKIISEPFEGVKSSAFFRLYR
jgi:deoxycytidylate deaminase